MIRNTSEEEIMVWWKDRGKLKFWSVNLQILYNVEMFPRVSLADGVLSFVVDVDITFPVEPSG